MQKMKLTAGALALAALATTGCAQRALHLPGGERITLIRVEPGTFMMGSPPSEAGRGADEGPQQRITIEQPFYLSDTEITQAQWQAVMGSNPSWYQGDDLPVNRISWHDAIRFCQQLSADTGRVVRPPTEAEWEYACRAGTDTPYSFGRDAAALDAHAWHAGNAPRQPSPVKQKEPNPWGFYDMHGNVWEWCLDPYYPNLEDMPADGSVRDVDGQLSGQRVLRGGSWFVTAEQHRCAERWSGPAPMASGYIGLRIVVEAD